MTSATIHVSIVIPAYNAAATITAAIDSALRQTEQNLEILVIDDASADTTAGIVARLAAQDGRVRLLRQAVNRGPAAARNRGLDEARGTWIALLDADDEFVPRRIETLMGLGNRHAADLVADNLLLCPEPGTPGVPMIEPGRLPREKWMSAAEFVAGNVGSRRTPRVSYGFLQPLIRRAFLDINGLRYEEKNRFGEDFLFALACLLKGGRWWLTPEPMYRYNVRPGSLTEVQSARDLLRIRTVEDELLRHHPAVAWDRDLANALRRHKAVIEHFYYYRAFTDALKAGAFGRAISMVLRTPRSVRHILTESAMQAPRVAIKALRGGYRQAVPAVSTLAEAGIAGPTGKQA